MLAKNPLGQSVKCSVSRSLVFGTLLGLLEAGRGLLEGLSEALSSFLLSGQVR